MASLPGFQFALWIAITFSEARANVGMPPLPGSMWA